MWLSRLERDRAWGLGHQALGTKPRQLKAQGSEPGKSEEQETTLPLFPAKTADAALGARGSEWDKSGRRVSQTRGAHEPYHKRLSK